MRDDGPRARCLRSFLCAECGTALDGACLSGMATVLPGSGNVRTDCAVQQEPVECRFRFEKVQPSAGYLQGRPGSPQLPNGRKTEIVPARRCHVQRLKVRRSRP